MRVAISVCNSEESNKWENLEPRQLQSAFPCFPRRRFLPWRRLPCTSRTGTQRPGKGPLLREGHRRLGAEPAIIPLCSFPKRPLQRFFKTCAQLAGVSLRVIRLAVQGELLPVTAAVLRWLPSPPEAEVKAAAQGCRPAAGSGCGGRQQQRVRRKKIKRQSPCGGRTGAGCSWSRWPQPSAVRSDSEAKRA